MKVVIDIVQQIPDAAEIDLPEALEWALYRLRWSNNEIRNFSNQMPTTQLHSGPEALSPQSPRFPTMKRPSDPTLPDPASNRPHSRRQSVQGSRMYPTGGPSEDRWRNTDSTEQPPSHPLHHRGTSLSGGIQFGRTESPSNVPHSALMLPSPTSLNLPVPPGLSAIPSSSTFPLSPAHAAHLQELQHQVSVKTLTLQTLQREYDNLLQKLERMRTKCATLEKKFEVSDAEINSLTDERERLEKQVETLEKQLEDAQNARDEARNSSAEQASQYMKIMEMAGRLQAQASDDRRRWETEREKLSNRVAELQEANLNAAGSRSLLHQERTTSIHADLEADLAISRADIETDFDDTSFGAGSDPNQTLTTLITVSGHTADNEVLMHREVMRLEARVESLQIALRVAQEESKVVREAALALAGAGQRLDEAIKNAKPGAQEAE